MPHLLKSALASTAFAAASLTASTAFAAPTWTIVDLGYIPPGVISSGAAINDNGWVTGRVTTQPANGGGRTFVHDGTALRNLGPDNGRTSEGKAINNAGVIAGDAYLESSAIQRAVRYNVDGSIDDLGTLRPNNTGTSRAWGINEAGTIVGQANHDSGTSYRGVIWNTDGSKTTIGTFANGNNSYARDINDHGQVTGAAQRRIGTSQVTRAFIYDNGSLQDIGAFEQNGTSFGAAINNDGWVVGNSTIAGASQAFLYDGSQFLDIGSSLNGASSSALDINDLGQVVGSYATATGTNAPTLAFLYSNGLTIDLNSLLEPGSGWRLTSATGINEAGQITGHGIYSDGLGNNYSRAFLLSAPIPEASEWMIMLAGLGAAAGLAGRRRRANEAQTLQAA